MSITAEKKAEVIKDNARADNDTGSPEELDELAAATPWRKSSDLGKRE